MVPPAVDTLKRRNTHVSALEKWILLNEMVMGSDDHFTAFATEHSCIFNQLVQ